MKFHSMKIGVAVLGVLTTMGFSQSHRVSPATRVETLGPADQSATTHFNVYFPLTHQDALDKLLTEQTTLGSRNYHQWLTPAQFKAQFGPNPSNVAKVKALLQGAGFTVLSEKTQSIEVQGLVSAVDNLFSTSMQKARTPKGHMRLAAAQGRMILPQTMASAGVVIPEFTPHLAHVHSQHMAKPLVSANPAFRLSSNDSFFYPNDMRESYLVPSFLTQVKPPQSHRPVQLTGAGATIGIVMSSVINPSDLAATFNSTLNLTGGQQLIQAYSKHTKGPCCKKWIAEMRP